MCDIEDYIFIAKLRDRTHTSGALWRWNSNKLSLEFEPTEIELSALYRRRKVRFDLSEALEHPSCNDLRRLILSARGDSGCYTRNMLLDILIDLGGPASTFELDPDQANVIAKRNNPKLVMYAGPGAGKTTTLCHLIKKLCSDRPHARILALAYNRAAEQIMDDRLKTMCVPRIQNSEAADIDVTGIAIMTFDKLGYRVNERDSRETYVDDMYSDDEEDNSNAAPGDSYRDSLRIAAASLARSGFARWDVIIVDEGQDILPLHASIINSLCRAPNNPQLIAAGDPRQELYTGARWFSDLWASTGADDKVVLRYNHRSAPEIVNVLNVFSRANFPLLHQDQIATRPAGGSVQSKIINTRPGWHFRLACRKATAIDVGDAVGLCMSESRPGDCYAVSPLTINKFGNHFATSAARQTMHDRNPNEPLYSDGKLTPGKYYIATSKTVKGTERSKVVLFAADTSYKVVTSHSAMVKLLFVAISRARDALVIVSRNNGQGDAPAALSPLYRLIGGMVPKSISESFRRDCAPHRTQVVSGFNERNGLCESLAIDMPQSNVAWHSGACIDLGQPLGDDDFLCAYSEALVADALGISMAKKLSIVVVKNRELCGLYRRDGGTFEMKVLAHHADAMQEVADIMLDQKSSNAPYVHATLKYSLMICRAWTVSDRFATRSAPAVAAAKSIADMIRSLFTRMSIKYIVRGAYDVRGRRAANMDVPGIVAYTLDLEIDGCPVGIKYVDELTDKHRRQAAVFATVRNAPRALLINTRRGVAEWILASDHHQINRAARALVTMQHAKSMALSKLKKYTMSPTGALRGGFIVIADAIREYSGGYLEIAALAINTVDWEVEQIFDHAAADVTERSRVIRRTGNSQPTIGELANLSWPPSSDRKQHSADIHNKFNNWIAALPVRPTIVHWDTPIGTDSSLDSIDAVHDIFHPWLVAKGESCRGVDSLSDAVKLVVPDILYTKHRAFENVIAIAGVAAASYNIDSVL